MTDILVASYEVITTNTSFRFRIQKTSDGWQIVVPPIAGMDTTHKIYSTIEDAQAAADDLGTTLDDALSRRDQAVQDIKQALESL